MSISAANHGGMGARQPSPAKVGRRRHKAKAGAFTPCVPPGCPYDFLSNRLVYIIVSARARGLSVGVNFSPERGCNFDCAYCEVERDPGAVEAPVDVELMAGELERTLRYAQSSLLATHPVLGRLPGEFRQMSHVAISGLGEPTLSPNFVEAMQEIIHLRAMKRLPFFKLLLVTNGSHLDSATVQAGLKYLDPQDEIWIKLDAGTQAFMNKVNRTHVPLAKVLANILATGRQRPVVIQSLFAAYDGQEPPEEEIEQYVQRLKELKEEGAQISLVQVYSAVRPPRDAACSHLPLKTLSHIAQRVRAATGLQVEVF
jgi:wyosine [tRNA(Phe)-imidazoG37] synthetase (radical SAM superfamily)